MAKVCSIYGDVSKCEIKDNVAILTFFHPCSNVLRERICNDFLRKSMQSVKELYVLLRFQKKQNDSNKYFDSRFNRTTNVANRAYALSIIAFLALPFMLYSFFPLFKF